MVYGVFEFYKNTSQCHKVFPTSDALTHGDDADRMWLLTQQLDVDGLFRAFGNSNMVLLIICHQQHFS
jgi:hypothetical protein